MAAFIIVYIALALVSAGLIAWKAVQTCLKIRQESPDLWERFMTRPAKKQTVLEVLWAIIKMLGVVFLPFVARIYLILVDSDLFSKTLEETLRQGLEKDIAADQ